MAEWAAENSPVYTVCVQEDGVKMSSASRRNRADLLGVHFCRCNKRQQLKRNRMVLKTVDREAHHQSGGATDCRLQQELCLTHRCHLLPVPSGGRIRQTDLWMLMRALIRP